MTHHHALAHVAQAGMMIAVQVPAHVAQAGQIALVHLALAGTVVQAQAIVHPAGIDNGQEVY